MEKIVTIEQGAILSKKLRSENKIIVLVGGCFDILHMGHKTFLENAKRAGDIVFVALESDANVTALKGKGRPVHVQQQRAYALSLLHTVDYVLLLSPITTDTDYQAITESIKPDIIAITQGDPAQAKKEEHAQSVGGKVVVVSDYLKKYSTTKILSKQ